MYKVVAKWLLLALLSASTAALADTLKIPLGQQSGQTAAGLPQRGQSQTSVLRAHGEPARRHASVGQPPITRWDYPGFSVYFEYDHVINSVRQHQGQSR
ncbi:phosphodiesterase [Thiopseudomonas denitrificans]|uniref:Phosphodiesterase n=1 Tax=Thiopseudomonas denitrificans TaxID=1501432 RepID=A0A4R6U5Y3_9GAMM|nr:phosphodiesterase [Thiopseudomonas denitrificans]TDQ40263.1 hypothetical protein DFQ45_101398 [Thiopseudomonas denitrificans]